MKNILKRQKRTFLITLAATCLCAVAPSFCRGQGTNVPPTGLGDFGNTILGYFTSFNTNLDVTFGAQRFDLWVGGDSLQNGPVPLVNEIGLSYDVARFTRTNSTTQTGIDIENVIRNGGVTGTLVSEGLGLGFSVIVHDVKLTVYAQGVYDFEEGIPSGDRFNGEVGIRVKKALGTHFYSGVLAGALFPKNSQVFGAFMGATF